MKTEQTGIVDRLGRLLLPAVAAILLLSSGQVFAETELRGSYAESAGNEIVLLIEIGTPAPSSLIVVQYLPRGVKPVSASPPYQKFNGAKGKVKWLLKQPGPGSHRLHLQLDRPVAKGGVSALLRCKNPSTGQFMNVEVR